MSVSERLWRPVDIIGCQLFGRFFVGGSSIEEVLKIGAEFKRNGYKVTYNLLGEHEKDLEVVGNAVQTTKEIISAMDDSNKGNVSIKPTLHGLEISPDLFFESAKVIIDTAKESGIETEFDAEARKYIPDTFRVFSEFASKFHYKGFVRQAVQAHLVDIYDLMDEYDLWKMNLRIVEGSQMYPELPGVILENREQVLEQYFYVIRRNHMEGQVPFVATVGDRNKVNAAKRILPSPHMLEFQMLYGLFGKQIGEKLLKEGYSVRIYIPFVVDWCKDEWKQYGLRRAAMMRRLIWREIKYELDKR